MVLQVRFHIILKETPQVMVTNGVGDVMKEVKSQRHLRTREDPSFLLRRTIRACLALAVAEGVDATDVVAWVERCLLAVLITTKIELDGVSLSLEGISIVDDIDDVVPPAISVTVGRRQTCRHLERRVVADRRDHVSGARVQGIEVISQQPLELSLIESPVMVVSLERHFVEIIVGVVELGPVTNHIGPIRCPLRVVVLQVKRLVGGPAVISMVRVFALGTGSIPPVLPVKRLPERQNAVDLTVLFM